MSKQEFWNSERDDLLRGLYADEDMTITSIGVRIGRSSRAIADRAKKLGLVKPKFQWSEDDLKIVKRMWLEEGRTASDIADHFGSKVTKSSILGVVHREGYKRNHKAVTKQRAIAKGLKPALPEPEKPFVEPEAPPGWGKTIEEIGPNECRYMIGDRFCGAETDGGSYCCEHQALCYRPAPPIDVYGSRNHTVKWAA